MIKITKRAFIDALTYHEHLLCSAILARETDLPNLPEVLKSIDGLDLSGLSLRTVAQRKSNCLIFSDDSRLYFDSFAKREYYNDEIAYAVVVREVGSPFVRVMAYAIKEA